MNPFHNNFTWSGRADLNGRPLAPQASALTRLRHAPIRYSQHSHFPGKIKTKFQPARKAPFLLQPEVSAAAYSLLPQTPCRCA